jgi:dUTP pyrophosphatase
MSAPGSHVVRVRAVRPGAAVPERAYDHDAAFDLVAAEGAVLWPGERVAVPCGIALELPPGTCALVLPRSGLALRHGITLPNAPGLIDPGYRGEVQVILQNGDAAEAFTVEPGMRVAQLLVLELPAIELVAAPELAPSERGERGLGSSGVERRPA